MPQRKKRSLPVIRRFPNDAHRLKNLLTPIATGILFCTLLVFWFKWGWADTSPNSLQWMLNAVTQSMAILMGLVLGAYVLMQDRAERSLDYLRQKQTEIAHRLLGVFPATVAGFMELRTSDNYWEETHRKVGKLWLALLEMFPEVETSHQNEMVTNTLGLAPICNEIEYTGVAQLVINPVHFLRTLNSISNLAPFEPGYPQRSLLSEFRREYNSEIGRHIRTVERARWVCKGPGRLLPITLGVTFLTSVLLLLVGDTASSRPLILWGVGLVLVLAVGSLALFSLVAGRLIQPVSTSSASNLQKLQVNLGRNRLSA